MLIKLCISIVAFATMADWTVIIEAMFSRNKAENTYPVF